MDVNGESQPGFDGRIEPRADLLEVALEGQDMGLDRALGCPDRGWP